MGFQAYISGVHTGFSREPEGKMPNPTLTSGFKATMEYQMLLCPLLFSAGMTMDLRQNYRKMRRALSESERQLAAHRLFSHFLNLPFLNSIRHIAAYLAVDGEIDPVLIIQWCWKNQKLCYLPKLTLGNQHNIMQFLLYTKNKILKLNKFNIPEPETENADEIKAADQLDLILLPLVAFDQSGHRLGMGKGYYDAVLWGVKKPFLLGLGYDFQCVEKIVPHEKDVGLDGILTDQKLILLRN